MREVTIRGGDTPNVRLHTGVGVARLEHSQRQPEAPHTQAGAHHKRPKKRGKNIPEDGLHRMSVSVEFALRGRCTVECIVCR